MCCYLGHGQGEPRGPKPGDCETFMDFRLHWVKLLHFHAKLDVSYFWILENLWKSWNLFFLVQCVSVTRHKCILKACTRPWLRWRWEPCLACWAIRWSRMIGFTENHGESMFQTFLQIYWKTFKIFRISFFLHFSNFSTLHFVIFLIFKHFSSLPNF